MAIFSESIKLQKRDTGFELYIVIEPVEASEAGEVMEAIGKR